MRNTLISLTLAVAIGVVIGLLLQSPPTQPDTSSQAVATTDGPMAASDDHREQALSLATLAQQLQQETNARLALQQEVQSLRQQLARLQQSGDTDTGDDNSETDVNSAENNPTTTSKGRGSWFNQQALIDAGMEEVQAEQLKARFEKVELDKLYLRDRAVREGWAGGRRYRQALEKIEAQTDNLKSELDEKSYAAYLYASGQPNRVAVESVLDGSAAGTAGIQPGDQIVQYADQRIYNWRDLRQATTEGDANNSVPVKILRNGSPLELYVPRGPLGIRMSSVSIAPE
jgi:membrane-associated protease RseP (regulator of RpoE activity)